MDGLGTAQAMDTLRKTPLKYGYLVIILSQAVKDKSATGVWLGITSSVFAG
jgi:hypothetical protein